jgi:curli biogenesis system outer membrane secretion channel CsgG
LRLQSFSWLVGVGTLALVVSAAIPALGQSPTIPPNLSLQPLETEHLVLKRRIAIGRFSNATQYGRALLLPGESDPLADQAGDMLTARLVSSQKFIVLERRDAQAISHEQSIMGGGMQVGADTLLVGSVTQFGRKAEGKVGFLNSQGRQVASATVEIRLVDTRTGQAWFSTAGSGSASVAVSEVAGFGSRAAYDSTLNDQAIAAAISDLITNLMQKLQERPWSTDVLSVQGPQVLISGGVREGLTKGLKLTVSRRGPVVVSQQSGLPIELPSEPVATLQVVDFFGSGDAEGSKAVIVEGHLEPPISNLIVTSAGQ